jgi:hypothetical protein
MIWCRQGFKWGRPRGRKIVVPGVRVPYRTAARRVSGRKVHNRRLKVEKECSKLWKQHRLKASILGI